MTLRSTRRRISPRTRHRYRVIREFFRHTIGSSSQHENSGVAASVIDLKQKIIGLEQQIDEVTRHCYDIVHLDNCSRTTESLLGSKHNIDATSEKRLKGTETKLLYKTSDGKYNKYEDSDYAFKPNKNQIMVDEYYNQGTKEKNKKIKVDNVPKVDPDLHNHKPQSLYNNGVIDYSPNGFHSLTNVRLQPTLNKNLRYCNNSYNRTLQKKEYLQEVIPQRHKFKNGEENIKRNKGDCYEENIKRNNGDCYKEPCVIKPINLRKGKKLLTPELDQDFIKDIIHTQYDPVKIFDPKESDLSQFSVPVCQDRKFSDKDKKFNDSELCFCVYDDVPRKRPKHRRQGLNTIRSICDAHFYNSKIHERLNNRRKNMDAYGNSDIYDLVPVKEKSSPKEGRKVVKNPENTYNNCREVKENPSPKIRRKIIENSNTRYREVPPSPRSFRPQLNLEAQYFDEFHKYCGTYNNNLTRRSPVAHACFQEYMKYDESNMDSDITPANKVTRIRKQRQKNESVIEKTQTHDLQDTDVMSNIHVLEYVNDQTSININTPLNKTQVNETNFEKTDKALCEIKDVLQNFLQEIKKETIASQCDKPDISCNSQNATNDPTHNTINLNSNTIPNSTSFNNYNVGHCGLGSHVTPFSNPCCYPMLPLYPVTCPMTISGGYLIPNQSFSCTNCGNVSKESKNNDCCNKSSDPTCQTETEKLIKEIYNFIAHGPVKKQGSDRTDRTAEKRDTTREDAKILTSRSVGGSYRNFRHDAKIGTGLLKCYSKSCEAIGSRTIINSYYNEANPSYSDTFLEKLSLEVTHSSSDNEVESTDPHKAKSNKFSRALRSFGIFKKKKKDVTKDFSGSESVIDVHMTARGPSQFRQDITNYPMYRQEHYHPSPVESLYPKPHEYQPEIHNYQSRLSDYQSSPHEYPPKPHEYHPVPHGHQSQPREYQTDYQPPYNSNVGWHPSPQLDNPYVERPPPRMRRISPISQYSRHSPTVPPLNIPYQSSFGVIQPPLCLKEIEVKSTGTQSERKVSLFRKFKKKYQKPVTSAPANTSDQYQPNLFTQTPQVIIKPTPNTTKPLFNWKRLHSKAMQGLSKNDTLAYSLKTQKELAEGDIKLKKVMLKKLFHKKNPFSSRNLIMKTLLGKDEPNYAQAPHVVRPRLFL